MSKLNTKRCWGWGSESGIRMQGSGGQMGTTKNMTFKETPKRKALCG